MISKHIISLILALAALLLAAGCAGTKGEPVAAKDTTTWGTRQLISKAESAARQSLMEQNNARAKELALKGRDFAERCIMASPEEAGCYYWRAVNTGLYYRIRVIGYQRGVKRMIEDCQKVISLDEGYDHAGAYRMLGELYTQLPQTGGTADSVTRDLDLAEKNLRRAVKLAPDYPENHVALAEALYAQEKTSAAMDSLAKAKALVPQWKHDISYGEWNKSVLALEKKVHKASK